MKRKKRYEKNKYKKNDEFKKEKIKDNIFVNIKMNKKMIKNK